MKVRVSLLGFFLWLIVAVGCSVRSPTADAFVGTWVMTQKPSSTEQGTAHRARGKLTLLGNGEFVADSVPSGLLYSLPGMNSPNYVSGTGAWKLGSVDRDAAVLLTFRAIKGTTEYKVPNGTQLLVDDVSKELLLYFFLGDPDEGDRIEFRKAH